MDNEGYAEIDSIARIPNFKDTATADIISDVTLGNWYINPHRITHP